MTSPKLTVPVLDANPLIEAETAPQKIIQFIEQLPMAKPLEASAQLLEEIEALNRQKIAPDTRINALEAYRNGIIQLGKLLAAHYSNVTLPLPEDAKNHAIASESLWRELAYGYKLAVIDQKNKLLNIGGNDTTAFAIQRAMDALSQQASVYYHTYFTTLNTIWSDMHQLYLHAAKEKLEAVPIRKNKDPAATSINLTYKQALLMSLADPQHLAPEDINLVAQYISRHGRLALLHDLAAFENPAGIFLVSLQSDQPPIPYAKNTKKTDPGKDILFVTIELARQVHQDIQLLHSGEIPPRTNLPKHVSQAQYLNLLLHLFHHWGIAPTRTFPRTKKIDAMQMGVGLEAACHLVGSRSESAAINSSGELKASRWQVLNTSAGGIALRNAGDAHADIQVGKLLCLKSHQDNDWSIGVVRRAIHNTHHQIEIGAQLISPSAIWAAVRMEGKEEFCPVLLLPEISALRQPCSIVANRGIYLHGREIELKVGVTISKVMMTKLVDQTDHFDRFNFTHA